MKLITITFFRGRRTDANHRRIRKPQRLMPILLLAAIVLGGAAALNNEETPTAAPTAAISENREITVANTTPQATAAPEPEIGATGALLMDAETGCVLWDKNGYELLTPASTTKILTALVTMDMDTLTEETTISSSAAAIGESSAHLQAGEVFTVENLLKGALVKSANDACHALGEAVAGSEPLFVDWMEIKAQSLGAYDVQLANTNGLPAENHYLSAYDLALIARTDLQKPLFREIVASRHINMEGGNYTRSFKNTNKLLFSNPNVIGIKTGTTDKAGACLVSAMERDGRTVIAVVLHSPDRYGESLRLLNYGIDNFQNISYAEPGERVGFYPIGKSGENGVFALTAGCGRMTLPKDSAENLHTEYRWKSSAKSIKKGDTLGTMVLKQGDQDLQYIALTAEESASTGSPLHIWEKLKQAVKRIFV